ncbi:MAG: DUF5683 domain-containing protein [Flavobacteriales bacterium]
MVHSTHAQLADQTPEDSIKIAKPHSARKATLLSTALPGAGQIYNKKYWKAPIVWAGLGTCVYFIQDNRKFFNLYKDELQRFQTVPGYEIALADSRGNLYDDSTLEQLVDRRKRWLDLSYFSLIAVYGLNILDANVDGHLFNYDISPDISMEVRPTTVFIESPKAGLSITLKF